MKRKRLYRVWIVGVRLDGTPDERACACMGDRAYCKRMADWILQAERYYETSWRHCEVEVREEVTDV